MPSPRLLKGAMASPRQPKSKTVPELRFCPRDGDIPELPEVVVV